MFCVYWVERSPANTRHCWCDVGLALITKTIDTTSLAINLYGYAAGGETSPVLKLDPSSCVCVIVHELDIHS